MDTDSIRSAMVTARKNRNRVTVLILSVLLGEVQSLQSRQKFPVSSVQFLGIINKLKDANIECMKFLRDTSERYRRLVLENLVLDTFIPQPLSLLEIKVILRRSGQLSNILSQKTLGKAAGIAIKLLNSYPNVRPIDADVVFAAVGQLYQEDGDA